jgi:hypothetical protein
VGDIGDDDVTIFDLGRLFQNFLWVITRLPDILA